MDSGADHRFTFTPAMFRLAAVVKPPEFAGYAVGAWPGVVVPGACVAALGTFVGKMVAFMIVLAVLRHSAAFNGKMLGITALACILAWSASQVVTSMKLNLLYVEPDGESGESKA